MPSSLSPSKVSSFKDCALAFRLSAIDRLPEPPSIHAVKGTVVHRALQLLMAELPAGERTLSAATEKLHLAAEEILRKEEYAQLDLQGSELNSFLGDAEALVQNYFILEDPNTVQAIGTELDMSIQLGSLKLRGIIDRLELDENGDLIISDYKTGRAPSAISEQSRLIGVHFYSMLCERLLGKRPVKVQLLHLREPLVISTAPTEQSVKALERQTLAIWTAVERACRAEDFRPKPGRLCSWCSFQPYCPAMGGDLSLASRARTTNVRMTKPECSDTNQQASTALASL